MAATDNLIQFNLGPQHPSTHGVLSLTALQVNEISLSTPVDRVHRY